MPAPCDDKCHKSEFLEPRRGIEINDENASNPNIAGLQAFIDAYRSPLSYDATTPPNTCEGGMRIAARTFNIPLSMPTTTPELEREAYRAGCQRVAPLSVAAFNQIVQETLCICSRS
jgi:hypothetical protein